MNVTFHYISSRFIGATIIWIIRNSMSSNGVQKGGGGKTNSFHRQYSRNWRAEICVSSDSFDPSRSQRWSEIIVGMKFHSSANHFARTCFWPLLIVDPSPHPIRAFHRSRSFMQIVSFSSFLSLSSCPRRKKTKRKLLERTRRTKVHSEIHSFVAAPR